MGRSEGALSVEDITMRIILHALADLEMHEAVEWYESQRVGLGDQFLLAVESRLERVRSAPLRFPLIGDNVRSVRTRRFPFSILYTISEDVIRVISVFHERRDPLQWKKRVPILKCE